MKKRLPILIFTMLQFISYGQVIKGVVLDKNTSKEIEFATVYFNGTSTGTCSDQYGNFQLDISRYATKPITISAIGYYSKTTANFSGQEKNIIKLKPKVYNINEAAIQSKSLVRQRRINLRLFREEFIGTTDNSWNCEILNEEDITFNYFNDEDTLKAYAKKPLIIKNRALGYNITYYLDIFEYYRDSKFVFFSGNFIFEENSDDYLGLIKENQEYVYRGSRMHFFRALYVNDLRENHFRIINSENKKVKYENIVIEDKEGNKYLKYKGNLRVYYFEIESKMIVSGLILFEENGHFDPEGIKWTGAMAGDRIADWLPLEYEIETK
jgi:CarboxypepD_reg-like domain